MPAKASRDSVEGLVESLLKGDKRSAGKLISLIEDDEPEAVEAVARIFPHTGRAHVVGLTGPPGVGKSSLINRLVRAFRSRGKTVGVVAVDPTSPYTGGAVLGDRIRMADTGVDPGVFIRSMATRGHAGGLALATFDAVRVLDAMGSDLVFVETVGAGQSEVEIASRAHTTVVVEMPLTGDVVQTMKAGILEIGDVYVVNKVDLGNEDVLVANLKFQLETRDSWTPPIIRTAALEGRGIEDLAAAIEKHASYLDQSGGRRKREVARARLEILENVQRLLVRSAASRKGRAPAARSSCSPRMSPPAGSTRMPPRRNCWGLVALRSARPLACAKLLPIDGIEELWEPGHAVAPGCLERGDVDVIPDRLKELEHPESVVAHPLSGLFLGLLDITNRMSEFLRQRGREVSEGQLFAGQLHGLADPRLRVVEGPGNELPDILHGHELLARRRRERNLHDPSLEG